jgi:phage-related protein
MDREIAWIKAARKAFEEFPITVQRRMARALDVAARGEMAEIAKPLSGLGSGVFEIALAYRSDAYRAVYAVKLGAPVWVIHAFQKKSRTGIKTPKQEIELIRQRLRRLQEDRS